MGIKTNSANILTYELNVNSLTYSIKLAYEYLNKATDEQKAIFFDNYNQTK